MYKCNICDKELMSLAGLGCHITTFHKIPKEEYYIKFDGKTSGKCENCGKNTTFLDIYKGYRRFCSRTCSNYIQNPIINNRVITEEERSARIEKVKNTWKNKSAQDMDIVSKKRSEIAKENSYIISKKRVETMSAWDDNKKLTYSDKLKSAWNDKTTEEIKIKSSKQKQTNIDKGFWSSPDNMDGWILYKILVRRETRKNIKKLFRLWNGYCWYTGEKLIPKEEYISMYPDRHPNTNKMGPTIDHILPVIYGFNNGILPSIIGRLDNLCICSKSKNCQKNQYLLEDNNETRTTRTI